MSIETLRADAEAKMGLAKALGEQVDKLVKEKRELEALLVRALPVVAGVDTYFASEKDDLAEEILAALNFGGWGAGPLAHRLAAALKPADEKEVAPCE